MNEISEIMHTIKSKGIPLIRFSLGFILCFSGYSKLFPIEPFEMTFVEIGVSNWDFAPIFARLLIAVEFFLGLMLVFNLSPKLTGKAVIALLMIFTIYLVFVFIRQGNDDNCGCFGVLIRMNPLESIIKNLILIGLTLIIYFKNETRLKWSFNWVLIVLFALISTATPIILNPPNFLINYNRSVNIAGYKLNLNELGEISYMQTNYKLYEGKKIVCFFSMNCKFCKLAAQKLTIIQSRIKTPLPVFYFFLGEKKDLPAFWEASNSEKFPHLIKEPNEFFKYSGSSLPAVYLLKNDTVVKKYNFDEISEDEINDFLK